MSVKFTEVLNTELPDYDKRKADLIAQGYKSVRSYDKRTGWNNDGPEATFEEFKLVLFEGRCLTTRERNYYDDSDFYVVVYDPEHHNLFTYEYATTRFGGGGAASIDATDEVKDAAADVIREFILEGLRVDNLNQSKLPMPDRRVEVTRGRKVPKGLTGTSEWYGLGKPMCFGYQTVQHNRVRIHGDDGETYWTDAANVTVLNPDQYLIKDETLQEKALAYSRRVRSSDSGWHLPFTAGMVTL